MQILSDKVKLTPKSPQCDAILYDASPLGKEKFTELRSKIQNYALIYVIPRPPLHQYVEVLTFNTAGCNLIRE